MIEPIKFAKGGKSEKTTDIDIIKGIQNLLGANDEEMEQLLQVVIKKYGSIGKIGEAIQESVSSLPQGYSYEDVANAIMTVFSPEESQMFKCGGKMQQLVAKHSKGKKVDCGCGGTKIALGREGFPHGTRVITQKDTLDTYGLPTGEVVERRSFTYKPDIDYVVSSYKPEFIQKVSTNPTLQNNIGIFAEPFIGLGLASRRISPERYKQLESARNNTDFEVEEKQNGGIVKGQNGYSIDYPGHETVLSSPTRMQLSIIPSANTEKKDSSFIYQFDPDYTTRYVSVIYDKNGNPSYGLHTSDKRNGRRITEDEFSGYRNKWESLKEFFINNPEFNQRKSYTPFKAPITLNK